MKKLTAGAGEIFGVIGLGRFGSALAETLAKAGMDVIVVDRDEAAVRRVRDYVHSAFVCQELTVDNLTEAGIQSCDVVIVCIGSLIDVSVLTTLRVVSMGVKRVISKAINQEHGEILEKIGAEVVYPERDMAVRLGKRLISRNFLDYVSLDNNVEVRRIQAAGKLIGATVQDIDTRKKYGLNIVAIERDHRTDTDFSPQFRFESGDIISVIGRTDRIEKFESDIQAGD